MATADLTLVVVAKDHADLLAFDKTHCDVRELVLLVNVPCESMARIGNHYIDNGRGSVVGLVHADTVFAAGDLQTFAANATAATVSGIVGRTLEGVYRWDHNNPGEVSTLDSCSVFVKRGIGLRFDERIFDGLHCHVEDICLQAQSRGMKVIVPAAQAKHIGTSYLIEGFRSDYYRFAERLGRKWKHMRFSTT